MKKKKSEASEKIKTVAVIFHNTTNSKGSYLLFLGSGRDYFCLPPNTLPDTRKSAAQNATAKQVLKS